MNGEKLPRVSILKIYRTTDWESRTDQELSRDVIDERNLGVDELAQVFSCCRVAEVICRQIGGAIACAADEIDGVV